MIEKLLTNTEEYLKIIQAGFDEYQMEYFTERPPEFFCLELNGEAGELANDEKKLWKGKHVPQEKFADEAADVLIALMNYSNARKINLGEAVRQKLIKIDRKMKELKEKGEEY
jgi:NTP pyrophosphatase (non-canonical NTP hydrolase)